MLALNHISIGFGERTLFDDVSLNIGPHDRIALVGSNGAGKSTLLKIVAGLAEADSGSVSKAHFVTVGYLPQDGVVASGKILYDEVETALEDFVEIQRELAEAQGQLSTLDPSTAEYAEVLEVYGELQHKLEDLDAFRTKSKIERVLMGLGFSVRDFARQTEEFSGGWQMRIALAKLLLKEPSVLLLDEPTNHLDIDSLQWLESYLHQYKGAIVLVSHDRAFLDTLTTKTISLSLGALELYAGNYTFFERERSLRKEQQLSAFQNQQRRLQQTQRFIDRFRYKATKARQVQSRIKQLEKLELVEVEEEEEEIRFHFPPPQPSGAVVMELRNVSKRYGELEVFRGMNSTIERGDRIAIVGPNGAGKSTLSRILAGVESIDGGERIVGHNVVLSYFAQHQAEELDSQMDALHILDEVATGDVRTKLRTILGAFLFHGDDVFKRVGVLSGGEKSRLALAKMLLQPANFLIMDEPTNHLDMRSKKVLQDALAEYEGTFVVVSHDRSFLDPLVTKVVEVSAGGIRTIPGNVTEYLERRNPGGQPVSLRGKPPGGQTPQRVISKSIVSEKDRRRIEAEHRQELSRTLRPHREKLDRIEREIERIEKRKTEIETLMADPDFYHDGERAKQTSHEYTSLKIQLDGAYWSWGETSKTIDAIEEGYKPSRNT